MLEIAEKQARSWACPNGGHSGETDDPAALAVLDVFAALCDVERECLRTCPRWHALQTDVVRATRFHQYTEAGCPDAIEHDPPVALIRAAHLVAGANAARLRAEQAEREKNRA